MKLYIRQTRQILKHNIQNQTVYVPDEILTNWKNDDSFFHCEEENSLQKNIPITAGFVFTEERFIPVSDIEIKTYMDRKDNQNDLRRN